MAGNKNLSAAKAAKKDEFYTQLSDIENELKHYRKHFQGKTVLCNCDDPYESNFFKYFALNFNALGLKKLICTCYDGSPVAQTEQSFMDVFFPGDEEPQERERKPYLLELTEVCDLNGDGAEDLRDVDLILQQHPPRLLKGNGDFRSAECVELLKEADIVVTNPPFSLFREYVAQLMEYGKKFLILGNMNALKYKEIFPLLKENKLWIGFNNGAMSFKVPELYDITKTNLQEQPDGTIISKMGNIYWYTNLDHNKRHEPIDLYKHYTAEEYPKYENYDAIHVKEVNDTPVDYDGVMGVPITFMDKYCPEQFEIIGIAEGDSGKELGLKPYPRELKKLNKSLRDGQLYYMQNGIPQKPYTRILIRKIQKP